MRERKVWVQDSTGDIAFEAVYNDMNEMLKDIEVLSKPSMYGTDHYRIIIQMAN